MSSATINSTNFSRHLVNWYEANKRDLPWRQTNNPYYIWISEVMLQQTQVDTVIPYYERFITEFPTPWDLAEAPEDRVLKAWEGLGYYSRARNLHSGVKEVSEQYNGTVPKNKKDLLSIKGVGPYTAGAVLSIAYHQAEPAVDGNVMRVMSRVLLIGDDIAKQKTRKQFESILSDFIPEGEASSFNQGLMELGALVCKPKNPDCGQCPVSEHCLAYEKGVQTDYPVKNVKTKVKDKYYAVLICRNDKGDLFIRQRPDTGLLATLWELPMVETQSLSTSEVRQAVEAAMPESHDSLTIDDAQLSHTFSHLKWHLQPVRVNHSPSTSFFEKGFWVNKEDLEAYAFPVSHQKILRQIK